MPAQAFVPLRFDPGEAYQFDWSHEGVEFNGLPLTVGASPTRSAPAIPSSASAPFGRCSRRSGPR